MKDINNINFEILWEGKPSGLWQRFLTKIHMNFTTYQISEDELIITKGFFFKKQTSCELYLLKDPELKQNFYQQLIKVGSVIVRVDKNDNSYHGGQNLILKNIENSYKVRKLLRDAIEDDVKERNISYFDKL